MNIRKIFIVLAISSIATSASADIPLRFNFLGDFVSPDQILQERAARDYKRGDLKSSINNFERSAMFGNDMSKYMIALIHIEKKDWITAYAWLQMVKEPIEKRDELLSKFSSLLTKDELQIANNKLTSLQSTYNDYAFFERRQKWHKSIRLTGTNIPGLQSVANNNLLIDPGRHDGGLSSQLAGGGDSFMNARSRSSISHLRLNLTLKNYLLEYASQGTVHLGEIKEK